MRIRDDIDRGAVSHPGALTFAGAALSYMQAGGDRRFLAALIERLGDEPAGGITQGLIDDTAAALYPQATGATRNRQVYTPIIAVLRHAGVHLMLHRPKGAQGQSRTDWITPDQARSLLKAAPGQTYRAFVLFLLHTGCRLSEALALDWSRVDLLQATATIPTTKSTDPRSVHLTPPLLAALANIPGDRTGRVFRLTKGKSVYGPWRAMVKAAGLPAWVTPHVMRHTYATWMRQFAGVDIKALVETGAWRDIKSVARYAHAVSSQVSRRADMLPSGENPGKRTRNRGTSKV
jgi:integrase